MNLLGLIAAVRTDADDLPQDAAGTDALLRTADIIGWLNEAVEEACIRKNLLFEDSNPEMCEIAVEEGTQRYPLHENWHLITKAWLTSDDSTCVIHLHLTTREALDNSRPNWRNTARDLAELIVDDTSVQFGSPVAKAWTLHLEGYRLPMAAMVEDDDAPEIARAHHLYLRHWALHRGYSVPDSELFNPNKAATAEAAFERYFGPRPDADLRRDQYADTPHHNTAYF